MHPPSRARTTPVLPRMRQPVPAPEPHAHPPVARRDRRPRRDEVDVAEPVVHVVPRQLIWRGRSRRAWWKLRPARIVDERGRDDLSHGQAAAHGGAIPPPRDQLARRAIERGRRARQHRDRSPLDIAARVDDEAHADLGVSPLRHGHLARDSRGPVLHPRRRRAAQFTRVVGAIERGRDRPPRALLRHLHSAIERIEQLLQLRR